MNSLSIRSILAAASDKQSGGRKIKDVLEETIICRISGNEFLRSALVIQGGAALHFAYSSPRYTNDIDFGGQIRENKKRIIKELAGLMPMIEGLRVNFSVKKEAENFIRVSYSIPFEKRFKPSVCVEGGHIPPLLDTVNYNTPFGFVKMENPQEIMADKILASMQRLAERGSIQGTHLFDFFFITQTHSISIPAELLLKKAEHYSFRITAQEIPERIRQVMKKIEETRDRVIENVSRQLGEAYTANFDFQKMLEVALGFLEGVAAKSRPRQFPFSSLS